MTRVILDTSAYSAFRRGLPVVQPYIMHENDIFMPIVVIGELRGGFAAGTKQPENERLLQEFLSMPNVSVATITDQTTQIFGNLYTELKMLGKPVGQNDLWIAAMALEHEARLLTFDTDFSRIAGLDAIIV